MLEKVDVFDPKYIDNCTSFRCKRRIEEYSLLENDIIFLKTTNRKKGLIFFQKSNQYYIKEVPNYEYIYKIVEIRRKE